MSQPLPPLPDLARSLAEGTLRATQVAEEALAAQKLDAYRTVDPQRTRAMAEAADAAFRAGARLGPLQGVPTSIKDLFGVPGWPTTGGTAAPLPAAFEPAGPVVQRLLDQLGVVTGKTKTVELAFGGIGTNPHVPTPINPWDAEHHRVPGGSSAGAGVSLAEGSALVAFGTDTAGSVRIPAAWTGTVGLKTTPGRWSTAGIVPLSPTLDTAGILTRTVVDAAFAFGALDPRSELIPRAVDLREVQLVRVGPVLWDGASRGVVEAVQNALAELPATVGEATVDQIPEVLELFGQGGPVAAELDGFLTWVVPEVQARLDPNVRSRVAAAGELSVREYLRRRHRLTELAAAAKEAIGDRIWVAPTVANTPPRVDEVAHGKAYRAQNLLALRNTCVASYLGLCAITLPCGLDAAGMPVGCMLMAGPNQEERLLGVALAAERVWGTAAQRLGMAPRLALA